MLLLDSRTLMVVLFALTLLIGVCLLITAWKGYPRPAQKSMRAWGLAYLIQALGWLLIGLEDHIPDIYSVVGANTLLLCSTAEIYQALRIFDGQTPLRKRSYALIALGLALCGVLLNVPHSMPIRITIISTVSSVFFALSAARLFQPRAENPSAIRRILGAGFVLLAAIYLLRCILTFDIDAQIPSLLANTPVQTLTFGGTALGIMIVSIGFLLLCTESFNNTLLRLATVDDLTGLNNRRSLEERTRAEMERARRTGQPLAFLLMDADDFKVINDTYGHTTGDAALQGIADTLKMSMRAFEIVGRLGGDEFAVVLPSTPEAAARMIAERLVNAIGEAPIYADGKLIKLSMSFGIAMFQVTSEPDFSRLVHQADQSLYQMKRNRKEILQLGA